MGRKIQCIICTSNFTKQVNDLLAKGCTYQLVVNFLKDKAIKLSTTSVMRHNNNHRLAKAKTKKGSRTSPKGSKKSSSKLKKKKYKAKQLPTGDYHLLKEERNLAAFERDMKAINARKQKVLKSVARLEEDFSALDKLALAVQLAEDRLFRSLEEEIDTKMVMPVTSHAMKDYISAVKTYTEASSGMNKTEFNFAQMTNVIGNIFAVPELSDQARAELLEMVEEYAAEPPPLAVVEDTKIDPDPGSDGQLIVKTIPKPVDKESKDLPET